MFQRCNTTPLGQSDVMPFSLQWPFFQDYDVDCSLSEDVQSDQSLTVLLTWSIHCLDGAASSFLDGFLSRSVLQRFCVLWVTWAQNHQRAQHELVETEGRKEVETGGEGHEEVEIGGGGHEEVETGGGGLEEAGDCLHLVPALGGVEAGYLPEAGDFDSIAGQLCSSYGPHHSMILLLCRDFQWFGLDFQWFVKVDLFAVGSRF